MSVYRTLTSLIEKAIFQHQVKNAEQCVRFIRNNSKLKSLDTREIERLMHSVATSYKAEQQQR